MRLALKYIKNFYIIYYSYKECKKYWFNNILSIISTIIFISISYFMWSAVYSTNLSYFTMSLSDTITYVVIITIINFLVSCNVESDLGNRVISGNISIDLIRPINFFSYLLYKKIGNIVFNIIFSIFPLVIIAIFIFKINTNIDLEILFYFIISIIITFFLVYIFEFIVGLASFFTNQIFGVSLLKSALVNIFAGMTIPLSYYPESLKYILFNLPFQSMYYIPVGIYTNSYDIKYSIIQRALTKIGLNNTIMNLIIEQIIWLIIISIIGFMCWNKSKRKLVIQGG